MDTKNKENQQDNMIDDALENFIDDKELQVSEKGSIDTNTCSNESRDSENSEKKAISIPQFIKEYVHEHKEETIGMIIAFVAWGINALHKKNSQKNENIKFDETGDDSLQLNENEQITQDTPTDEELLSLRDDQEHYIKSRDRYYRNGQPNRFYKVTWNVYDNQIGEFVPHEQYYGSNVDSAYEDYEHYQKRYIKVYGWCKTQTTDWTICWSE